jgi:oligopeptidase B
MRFVIVALLVSGVAVGTPREARAQKPAPPVAKAQPRELTAHGETRVDPYYWLRERENPEVVAYLERENAYTEAMTAETAKLQNQLFEEIRSRIKQDDSSVPYRDGGFYYYTRFEDGKEYPIYARKRGSLDRPEEIVLDANVLAEGHTYYRVSRRAVSPDGVMLAYAEDTVGRRINKIRFKNLETGETLPDVILDVTPNLAWANDSRTLFYTRQDRETLRYSQIFRHELSTDPDEDVLVYEETDPEFSTSISRTRSDAYLLINSTQTLATEVRFLDADDPTGEFRVILPRERNHEYSVDHLGDYFYILTNDDAKNFRLMRAPVSAPSRDHWEAVIPHRADVYLQGIEIFRDHLVVDERFEGLTRLRIMRWDGEDDHYLEFAEPAYVASLGANPEIDSGVLRFAYESMTTPSSVYDYDMETRERTLLKQDEVLGGFSTDDYVTERLFATVRDGTRVPISIVYRRGLSLDGSSPLLLYGYGSYGSNSEPSFSAPRLSLLDRGFVYARAHIRGSSTMGRQWYEDGKLFKKKNTFTDFVDVAEFLVTAGYADPNRLFAEGRSAGGLLMGAVVNMRPDLWKGVIAGVPFVDVITTMLDETIPLTTNEYDEWGNPNNKDYYDYMLSYSPYDQVEAKGYPNLLVTAGFHDSQVQYWEPAKWVAKLRSLKTDDNLLLLKTQMEAGHGGVSGRYQRYRNIAFEYAFLLKAAGLGL